MRAASNVLIDSPRFTRPLIRRLEELGGVALMFLTHADDVADHRLFHERFGCQRILHRADVTSDTHDVEIQPDTAGEISLDDEIKLIAVPGHTRGSMCLLYRDKYLFCGDHMAWNAAAQRIDAFRTYCWYSWEDQTASMQRLVNYPFEWLLPGHGRRVRLPAARMVQELNLCVARMQATA